MIEQFLKELKDKDLLKDETNEIKLISALKQNKKIYVGFDPTAPSLHLGNYVMLNFLKICDKYKIPYVIIVGGITGLIGDPSGKNAERSLLEKETVLKNTLLITKQLKDILKTDLVLNNADFYKDMHVLDFLRDVCKVINIKDLLGKEIIRNRLDTGISLTEFVYSVIQANDFYELFCEYDVCIEVGGSDQWSNITNGIDFVNSKTNTPSDKSLVCGFTLNLLLKQDGTKFGKSEDGAIFLNKPYKVFQFLLNQNDEELEKLLNFLTTYDVDQIKEIMIEHYKNLKLKYAQNKLIENVMINLYGLKTYEEIKEIASWLFDKKIIYDKTKITAIKKYFDKIELKQEDGKVSTLLLKSKIFDSFNQLNRMLKNKQIKINNQIITNPNTELKDKDLIVSFQNNVWVLEIKK